jgi:hypothetical protein
MSATYMHTHIYLAKLFHLEGLAAGTYGHAWGVLFIWYFDGSFCLSSSILIYTAPRNKGLFMSLQITRNRRREKNKNKRTTRER